MTTSSLPARKGVAAFAVALAAVGFGMVPFFAKTLTEHGMAAAAVAFHRYLLVAVVLSPFLALGAGSRRATAWGALAGAAMGLGWSGYVGSLALLPVSTAGIVYMSYPVFTVIIGWLWFRQGFTSRSLASSAMILVAAGLVLAPKESSPGGADVSGLLLALAAPIAFALAINILVTRVEALPPLSRVASLALGAVIGLLPLLLSLEAEEVLPATASDAWRVAGIALATALVPQLLFVVHAPVVGAAKSAMLGGVELPTMILIGWLAFGEVLGVGQLAAACLVLFALLLTPGGPPAFGERRVGA